MQKDFNSSLIFDRLEAVNTVHGESLPVCENVTNAEVFDGTLCTRGKLLRDVGHARICVVVVVCHVHLWNKPSGHTKLTVGLLTCI